MEEAQRLLNPWLLHLQKLGLELKCPLCLELFKQPSLLPCNHIFCSKCIPEAVGSVTECPACKHSYGENDVKPVPFMENVVNIFKNLDASVIANLVHPGCSDVTRATAETPASIRMDGNNSSRKENAEISQEGNSSNGQSMNRVNVVMKKFETPKSVKKQEFMKKSGEKYMKTGADGVGFIQMGQLSPPVSGDSKDADGNSSDPSSTPRNSQIHSSKRPGENTAYGTNLESNSKDTFGAKCQTNEVKKTKLDVKRGPCVFCQTAKETDGSGPIVSYARGKEVTGDVAKFSKVTHAHAKCIEWAPQIYFAEDGTIKNLDTEVRRANKLKCSSCGKKGAVLGCYVQTCQRSYHAPCAYDIPKCRWECEEYLLLCPKHESHKFPREKKSNSGKKDPENRQLNPCTTSLPAGKTVVLCGSALSSDEKFSLLDFARGNGAVVSKYWRQNVTHVIAATDSNGACTRTLKVLMAILNGKWILTTEWVKACAEAGKLVDEEPYEVRLDTHGSSGGPKAGRLRVLNNGPKLFNNLKFYFHGDFVQAFKDDLMNLVKTAGGTIAKTKDQLSSSNDAEAKPNGDELTMVVYNADCSNTSGFEDEDSMKSQRLAAAEDVAQEFGSMTVGHTWILESIAACSLLPCT